jgi:hypothetical protein
MFMDASTTLPVQARQHARTRGWIVSDVLLVLSIVCVALPLAFGLARCHDNQQHENALIATALFVSFVGTVLVCEAKLRLRGTLFGLNLRSAVVPNAVLTAMLVDRLLR